MTKATYADAKGSPRRKETVEATVIYSVPLATKPHLTRAILEMDSGGWIVGTMTGKDASTFSREFGVSVEDAQNACHMAMSDDVDIKLMFAGSPGKGLAAMTTILMLGLKLMQEKASS